MFLFHALGDNRSTPGNAIISFQNAHENPPPKQTIKKPNMTTIKPKKEPNRKTNNNNETNPKKRVVCGRGVNAENEKRIETGMFGQNKKKHTKKTQFRVVWVSPKKKKKTKHGVDNRTKQKKTIRPNTDGVVKN